MTEVNKNGELYSVEYPASFGEIPLGRVELIGHSTGGRSLINEAINEGLVAPVIPKPIKTKPKVLARFFKTD